MNSQTIIGKAIIGKVMTFSLALCLTGFATVSSAQVANFSTSVDADQADNAAYSASDLDGILAPIALYPDPLLAQILVATTFEDQIEEASQVLSANGSIDDQAWDDSVKVVAHYPRVLFALASQPDWTNSIGQAYVAQATDVMTSIQRLRAMAYAQGNLVTTAQQRVVTVAGMIQVLPAQLGFVFLPTYDPQVVFSSAAYVSFGPALAIQSEWEGNIDWHSHRIYDHHHHMAHVGMGRRGRMGRIDRTRGRERNRFNPGRDRGRVTRSRFNPNQPKTRSGNPKQPTSPKQGKAPTQPKAPTTSKAGKGSTPKTPTTSKAGKGQTPATKAGSNLNRGRNNTGVNRAQANHGQMNNGQASRGQMNRQQVSRGQSNRGSFNMAANRGNSGGRSAGRSGRR